MFAFVALLRLGQDVVPKRRLHFQATPGGVRMFDLVFGELFVLDRRGEVFPKQQVLTGERLHAPLFLKTKSPVLAVHTD